MENWMSLNMSFQRKSKFYLIFKANWDDMLRWDGMPPWDEKIWWDTARWWDQDEDDLFYFSSSKIELTLILIKPKFIDNTSSKTTTKNFKVFHSFLFCSTSGDCNIDVIVIFEKVHISEKMSCIREIAGSQFSHQDSFHLSHLVVPHFSLVLQIFSDLDMINRKFRAQEKLQFPDPVTSTWQIALYFIINQRLMPKG